MIFLTIGISLLFLIKSSSGNESDGELDSTDLIELNSCCNLSPDFNGTLRKCGGLKNVFANTSEIPTVEFPSHLMTNHVGSHFRLRNMGLDCQHGRKSYATPFNKVPVKPIFEFQPDGYMKLGTKVHSQYFDRNQYCVNGLNDSNLEVVACRRSCSLQTPCIRKCCPLDSYVNTTTAGCNAYAPNAIKWSATVFENAHDENTRMDIKSRPDILPWYLFHSATGWVKHCRGRSLLLSYEDPLTKKMFEKSNRYRLATTVQLRFFPNSSYRSLGISKKFNRPDLITNFNHSGSLRYRVLPDMRIFYWDTRRRAWMEIKTDNYCIDGSFVGDTTNSMTQVMLTCPMELPKERSASSYFGVVCLITSIFSIITVIVYILLWEKQTIHGWTIMSHAVSISLFFIFLGIAHLTRTTISLRSSIMCKMIATLAHFFFISTFSWLTMISLDLWMTFRAMSVTKSKHLQRFILYSLFGWGIPIVVVSTAWTLEYFYLEDNTSAVKVPRYGIGPCYITSYAILEYAYIPCGILLSVNLTFFGMTTWKLYQYKKATSFALFLKLFFVVGAVWIIEFSNRYFFGENITWYVQMLDTLTLLQPVAIFVIFVCKDDIIKSIIDKQPGLKSLLTPVLNVLTSCNGRSRSDDSTLSKMNETTMSKLSVSGEEEDTV